MNSKIATTLFFAQSALAAIPGRTLEDCNTFANLFANTCTVTDGVPQVYSDFANDSGETMNCTGDMRCPGATGSATYTSSNFCSFERKLCVSCAETSGTVYIMV